MTMDNPYAGKPVFGNSAYNPTRGTVNPAGYIKRGLSQAGSYGGVSKVGSTGRSETRSGLAKQALQQQLANKQQTGMIQQQQSPLGGQPTKKLFGSTPQVKRRVFKRKLRISKTGQLSVELDNG